MLKEYQITLVDKSGTYRPVSCLLKRDNAEIGTIGKNAFVKKLQKDGIIKICQKRYWTNTDLKKFGYNTVKVREYDKEKIEKENAERYERIKQEKYKTGEWKKPKYEE